MLWNADEDHRSACSFPLYDFRFSLRLYDATTTTTIMGAISYILIVPVVAAASTADVVRILFNAIEYDMTLWYFEIDVFWTLILFGDMYVPIRPRSVVRATCTSVDREFK